MAYCGPEDVQLNLQYLTLTETTKPSFNEVTVFCDQISADMDSRLKVWNIPLPVTKADKLALLKKIAADGVTAKIFRSLNTQETLLTAKAYQEEYDKGMEEIRSAPKMIDDPGGTGSPGYLPPSVSGRRKYNRERRNW